MNRTAAWPDNRAILLQSVVLCLLFPVSSLLAQECAELPVVPKPDLKSCSFINLPCQNENKRIQQAWEEQMRRFGTPMTFAASNAEKDTTLIEYKAGGCRGSLVNLELSPKKLQTLKYEITSPSGTTIATELLRPVNGRAVSQPIRLPESGFYQIRLTTQSAREANKECMKWEGSIISKKCVQEKTVFVFPYDFQVRFLGNAEAPALRQGERADGTVTSLQPISRRIAVDAYDAVSARVVAGGGGRISCRAETPEGAQVPATATPDGCQVAFPSAQRDVTYVLAITAAGNVPVGVTIQVTGGAPATGAGAGPGKRELVLGTESEGVYELTARPGDPALAQITHDWNFDAKQPGNFALTVVPSGLARLEVDVLMFNASTEELVIDRVRVNGRRVLNARIPVPGKYIVRLNPVNYVQGQTTAKYTIGLQAVR